MIDFKNNTEAELKIYIIENANKLLYISDSKQRSETFFNISHAQKALASKNPIYNNFAFNVLEKISIEDKYHFEKMTENDLEQFISDFANQVYMICHNTDSYTDARLHKPQSDIWEFMPYSMKILTTAQQTLEHINPKKKAYLYDIVNKIQPPNSEGR